MALIRNRETAKKIIRILQENEGGLTSGQIAQIMGTGLRRGVLYQLLKQGAITQRKGMTTDGRVVLLYVLRSDANVMGR